MGDAVRTFFIALVALCQVSSVAQAQEVPPIYVLAEEDDRDAPACQVSNTSISAAIESELSYNRVPVGTEAQHYRDEALQLHVVTTILVISGTCVVSNVLSLRSVQQVVLSVTGKTMFARVEICRKGSMISGPVFNMQSRLNAEFRDFTSRCISEYRKK
jgi:hypothetical protein